MGENCYVRPGDLVLPELEELISVVLEGLTHVHDILNFVL